MGILVALRLLHDSAIHFIFSLSFLHFFLVLLISHVFHFRTVCQKVKAENPNFSVYWAKTFCFWHSGKRSILTCWIQSLYCHGARYIDKRTRKTWTEPIRKENGAIHGKNGEQISAAIACKDFNYENRRIYINPVAKTPITDAVRAKL
jgi:predicted Holliday junction resolvase-like endonuclease